MEKSCGFGRRAILRFLPKPYGLVLALDEQGKIIRSLHDYTGSHLKEITSVREYGGYLYLGSLNNDRIGKYKLP
jgi:hypothetical protein